MNKHHIRKFLQWIGWYQARLSTRLLLVFLLITFVLLGSLLVFAAEAYRKDKIAYIYDVIDLRIERLSLQLQRKLFSFVKTNTDGAKECESLSVDELKIPRWPDTAEVFVGVCRERKIYIAVDQSGNKKFGYFDGKGFLGGSQGSLTYWVTSYGAFLDSSDEMPSTEADLVRRSVVREFLASGLTHGLSTVSDGQVIGGFREIPDSNTAVFVEMNLEEAMRPLNRFLALAAMIGLGIIFVGMAVGSLILKSLWAPIDEVGKISSSIAEGNYTFEVSYPFHDEIFRIFEHLRRMARMLNYREKKILAVIDDLRVVHETTLAMTRCADKSAAVEIARDACERNIAKIKVTVETEVVDSIEPHEELTPAEGFTKFGLLQVRHAEEREVLEKDEAAFLDAMATSLSVSCETIDLRVAEADKVRMENSLEVARTIQTKLCIVAESCKHLDISFWYQPAERIGGDWYGEFFDESRQQTYLYLGDVMGHGIPSALMTGVFCGSVCAKELSSTLGSASPIERMETIMRATARVMRRAGRGEIWATMVCACIDIREKQVHVVGAGHPFPILISGDEAKSIVVRGSILGCDDECEFHSATLPFNQGDALVLFTDGLIENKGVDGATMRRRELQGIVQNGAGTAAEISERICSRAREIWGDVSPEDDATVVVVKNLAMIDY